MNACSYKVKTTYKKVVFRLVEPRIVFAILKSYWKIYLKSGNKRLFIGAGAYQEWVKSLMGSTQRGMEVQQMMYPILYKLHVGRHLKIKVNSELRDKVL